jgi:hypothetical protein
MSEQEESGTPQSATGRVDRFAADVHALRVPNQSARLERRLSLAGIVLPLVGLAAIGLGWWGASGTKYVYQEIPYVISGGIFGVALVLIGIGLFARFSVARLLRFWLARLVAEQQLQADRVVAASERIADALTAQTAAIDRLVELGSGGAGEHPVPPVG